MTRPAGVTTQPVHRLRQASTTSGGESSRRGVAWYDYLSTIGDTVGGHAAAESAAGLFVVGSGPCDHDHGPHPYGDQVRTADAGRVSRGSRATAPRCVPAAAGRAAEDGAAAATGADDSAANSHPPA